RSSAAYSLHSFSIIEQVPKRFGVAIPVTFAEVVPASVRTKRKSLSARDALRNPLHFRNHFLLALVAAHSDPEQAPAVLYFENDHLRPPRRLHSAFAADMKPLD